jgi:predicted enzyme related to lactoylglutathione lyase
MSETEASGIGSIGWLDLTVPEADDVRDFYQEVIGWSTQEVDMGDYADYAMVTPDGEGVAGVCHARGTNAELPPVWMVYFVVADLDTSIAACVERGGRCLIGPKSMGDDRYCVIRDPAGAVCALYQKG